MVILHAKIECFELITAFDYQLRKKCSLYTDIQNDS